MSLRMPDLLIVGAPRSGTSALNHALAQHPSVSMSPDKEPRYFTERFDRGDEWYAAHFSGAAPGQLAGEASPDYLFRRAGERIAAAAPEAKTIALLREPVSRAWSHYWMRRTRDLEPRPFDECVDAELGGEVDLYVTPGRYAEQLDDMARWMSREHVHVELFEAAKEDPVSSFARICAYLGIDDTFRPADLGRVVNPQQGFRSPRLRQMSRRFPRPVRKAVARANRKAFIPPEMPTETRARLREHYAPHNERLARDWIDPAGAWML